MEGRWKGYRGIDFLSIAERWNTVEHCVRRLNPFRQQAWTRKHNFPFLLLSHCVYLENLLFFPPIAMSARKNSNRSCVAIFLAEFPVTRSKPKPPEAICRTKGEKPALIGFNSYSRVQSCPQVISEIASES